MWFYDVIEVVITEILIKFLKKKKTDTTSRLINCPFQLYGKRKNNVWVVEIRNGIHNHEASTNMSDHPSFCQLTGDEMRTVEYMSNSGVPPRQILSSLRQDNLSMRAISRTIYNIKTKIKKKITWLVKQ
jgi:malonate-semialdehyde dehydrogenase (acetylating) / methylmalonate-semialdehyde dehydrogenase